MSETLRDPIVMLFAGIGIPVFAALNAQLGARLGSPALAALVFAVVAFSSIFLYRAVLGPAVPVSKLLHQPAHLFFAGVLFAFYILSITTIAPRFGVGNAVFFVLLGQIISAGAIDHFGLFGAARDPINALRAAGMGTMALGLYMIQRA
ncbi:DMT family transporter [Celeribacter neptunius]|uniref:Transporter family-2 protein n=1 Tax=Celeribacter neptunius TaxID=588602 RepID=A0A1I3VFQ1_9RHOB|nr:DMT family transporter [Celeribacter neptunius]SFJ94085.1 transporter family-2 protein [Celeribacter neptunius]